MNGAYIDLRLLDRAWDQIEKSNDPRVKEKRNAVRFKYQAIKSTLVRGVCESDVGAQVPAADIDLRHSTVPPAQVAVAVLGFVARACDYYSALQTYRALTDQEKVIGRDLSRLLEQAENILPTGGDTDDSAE